MNPEISAAERSNTALALAEEQLLDALDDSPGSGSDLTPPVGAILAALPPVSRARRETPVRDKANPWVCSVLFEGDSSPRFLVGNAPLSSAVPLLFSGDPAKAMTAGTQAAFTFCWPFLIASHAREVGKRARAIVHRLNDTPQFA